MDYSIYIENETQEIKDLINKIFNHPLITGDNEKWIMQQNDFREFCSDGGTIDFYRIEDSVMGVAYIIKFLQKYKPKKILEVGMNVGSFSIIAKEVLGDVKIYSVDRQKGFVERQIQINDYYGEELISLLLSDSISNEFRNYAKENTPYDLAWIDGHHSEASSMFDIMTAINCGIPIICCDDCQPNTSTGVWKGIQKLVKNNLVKVLDYKGEITIIENVQEKDKVIWGYDRFENDLFVPNGYPNEQEYIEDTEKYLETFGKEKVVHNLFRELQTNQKLVDNISDNFLYPVEQFGAFDKLIGRDENYKEFCFLDHIKKSTLKNYKQTSIKYSKKGTPIFISSEFKGEISKFSKKSRKMIALEYLNELKEQYPGLQAEASDSDNRIFYKFKNGALKTEGSYEARKAQHIKDIVDEKYFMSWGWFEDHILNSFFSINLEITTGKNVESKQLQSVRSVFNDGKIDDRQYVRGQKCHISRNLHSKGLDTVILPNKAHPSAFDSAINEFDQDHIGKFLGKNNIEWNFNPPHASHVEGYLGKANRHNTTSPGLHVCSTR